MKKSRKTKIFTHKIENIGLDIFESRYKKIVKKELESKHGVYALYNKSGKLYYIGRSSRIKNRLKQHQKDQRKRKWERFSIYFTKNKEYTDAIEDALISIAGKPKGNSQNPSKVRKIDTHIKRAMREIDREIRENTFNKKNKSKTKRSKKFHQLRETEKFRIKFWKDLKQHMESNKTFLSLLEPKGSWYRLTNLETSCNIALVLDPNKKKIGCEFNIPKTQSTLFKSLEKEKSAIEKELGVELEWRERKNEYKIVDKTAGYNPSDYDNKENWPELFSWFKERAESFHKVFSKRIKELDLEEEVAA